MASLSLAVAFAGSRQHQPASSQPARGPAPAEVAPQIATAQKLLHDGKTRRAIALLREVIRAHPENGDAHLLLGAALVMVPSESQAIQELQRAVRLQPKSARAVYALGTAQAHFGNLKEAEEAFRKALSLDPRFAEAHVSLGLMLGRQKRLDDARTQFEEALHLQGTTPPAAYSRYLLSRVLAEQGQYDGARRELEAAVRIRPGYAEAYLRLGLIYKNQNQNIEALKAFKKAAELAPDNPAAKYQLGSALLRNGQADAAISHLREALKLQPNDRATMILLCQALFRAGKTVEAQACTQKASAQEKAREEASDQELEAGKLNNEGVELEKEGKVPEALEKYRQAVKLDPYRTTFRRNLALALCRLGRWNEGIAELHKVLKQDPADTAATKALYIALENARAGKTQNPAGNPASPEPK